MTIIKKIHDCITKDQEPPASPTITERALSSTSADTTSTESPGTSFILQLQRNVCQRLQNMVLFLVVSCENL